MKSSSVTKPPLKSPKELIESISALIGLMKILFSGTRKMTAIRLKIILENLGYNWSTHPALMEGGDALEENLTSVSMLCVS